MGNKPDLYERGNAARTDRLAKTESINREANSAGTGVIRRGNEALHERTGSDRYPTEGAKRD
jgi:hypothetical protein